MTSYEGEVVERALETLLQSNIAAALDAVESSWAAQGLPLTLPDPVNWSRGYRLFMVDLPSTFYPYVVVQVSLQSPQTDQRGRWGQQDVMFQGLISTFVVADSEDEITTMAHRYAEAISNILQANSTIGGAGQQHYRPQVQIFADNRVHLKGGYKGDPQNADDVDYIRMVEHTVLLEGS